jgi:hypothetical protein
VTSAQWAASIEPQGTLTIDMCPAHMAQALQDGDAALAGLVLAGTALTVAQGTARLELLSLFSIYEAAALAGPGTVLALAARTQLVTRGLNYYTVTGAP